MYGFLGILFGIAFLITLLIIAWPLVLLGVFGYLCWAYLDAYQAKKIRGE
jgi:hypothetical protein